MTPNEQLKIEITALLGGIENRDAIVAAIYKLLEVRVEAASNLAAQLSKLVSQESALTIPLADGTTAKVHFSQHPTRATLEAFSKIFQSIAENYVVSEESKC
jgi:hypothetical protein